jgi:hypothetical protein
MFGRVGRVEALEGVTASLVGENDRLRLHNASLQKENRTLRKRLPRPELRMVRRARLDADLLVAAHLGGLSTSRRASLALGISHRRWNWAMALMALARVRTRAGEWRTDDATQIIRRLDIAEAHIEGKGLAALTAHASKYGYSGNATRPKRYQQGRANVV